MLHIFWFILFVGVAAPPLQAQAVRTLQKSIVLQMPKGRGENGGTVAIHLKTRYYYATVTGNPTFSMAIFDGSGNRIGPPDLTLLTDSRGLWYDPFAKTFHANCYGKQGWAQYTLDEAGIPYEVRSLFSGKLQPQPNSVAAYVQREHSICFLKGTNAVFFDAGSGKEQPQKTIPLKIGYTKKNPPPANWSTDTLEIPAVYNSTTLIYTGIANAEIGLLNTQTHEIELYSKNDGLLTQRLVLPQSISLKNQFNFAFCNGIYWLYDPSARSWVGFR